MRKWNIASLKTLDKAMLKTWFFRYRRKLTIGAAVIFSVLFISGLSGYIFLPDLIKSKAEKAVAEQFHRKLSIKEVSFNPFSLSVTLEGVSLSEPRSEEIFASFDKLYVNVSTFSAFTFYPIIREVELINPYIHFARTQGNTYNISDFIELASQPGEPDKKPLAYSINNIQIIGGKIIFDDLPIKKQHRIEDIQIRIPFISSASSNIETFIEPYLSASVNGTKMEVSGKTRPFAEDMETVFNLELNNIDLPQYMGYLPYKPSFHLTKGSLSVDLDLHFTQGQNRPSEFDICGKAQLSALKMTDLANNPMIGLDKLTVNLDKSAVFKGDYRIAKVELVKPEIYAVNNADGYLNLIGLSPASEKRTVSKKTDTEDKNKENHSAFNLNVKQFAVKDAKLSYIDYAAGMPYSIAANHFNLTVDHVDVSGQSASVGKITSDHAAFEMALEKKPSRRRSVAKPTHSAKKESADSAFKFNIGGIDISGWSAHVQNKNLKNPLGARITDFTTHIQNISSEAGAISPLSVKANVDKKGHIAVNGNLGIAPLFADLDVNLEAVNIIALQQYIDTQVNLTLRSAEVSTKGHLSLSTGKNGDLKGEYKGDASLNNLLTTDQIKGDTFVRWKHFLLKQMDVQFAPFSFTAKSANLDHFFARLILSSDGRLNLQNILRSEAGGKKSLTDSGESEKEVVQPTPALENVAAIQKEEETTAAERIDKTDSASSIKTAESEKTDTPIAQVASNETDTDVRKEAATPADTALKQETALPPIKIGRFQLTNGKIRFTDNFIKPHYTANIDRISGAVTRISSSPDAVALVNLKGQVNHAPLLFTGSLNAFNPSALLDLKGHVKGMELAQFSSYSGKYVGYGIEKGKLSFDVEYKIEDGELLAENRLILDQLTFSETAQDDPVINLPVQLAVNLLKDGDGVIDINLPVSGSLNDPEFSVGGIVVRLIVNLIKKAVTAPFSLLASLGGGEELSWLDFAPGMSDITDKNEEKLAALVKALKDRPALKLDVTGSYNPNEDKEGLARHFINKKVRELKRKDMGSDGVNLKLSQITLNDKEYAEFLEEVYSDADFKKPRNFIGFQKSLPVAEMEKLIIQNYPVTEEDFKALADKRAMHVKTWLIEKGQIPQERIFIHASKSKSEGTRVDFSLH